MQASPKQMIEGIPSNSSRVFCRRSGNIKQRKSTAALLLNTKTGAPLQTTPNDCVSTTEAFSFSTPTAKRSASSLMSPPPPLRRVRAKLDPSCREIQNNIALVPKVEQDPERLQMPRPNISTPRSYETQLPPPFQPRLAFFPPENDFRPIEEMSENDSPSRPALLGAFVTPCCAQPTGKKVPLLPSLKGASRPHQRKRLPPVALKMKPTRRLLFASSEFC